MPAFCLFLQLSFQMHVYWWSCSRWMGATEKLFSKVDLFTCYHVLFDLVSLYILSTRERQCTRQQRQLVGTLWCRLPLGEENPQQIRRRSSGLRIYLESAEYARNILSNMSDGWLTLPRVLMRCSVTTCSFWLRKGLKSSSVTPGCCDAAMKHTGILPRHDTTWSIYISKKHGFIYWVSALITIPF